ncbi:hypothetical protein JCM7447_21150 [Corynebacterium amycolatum]
MSLFSGNTTSFERIETTITRKNSYLPIAAHKRIKARQGVLHNKAGTQTLLA